jgi:hypothetical protein
MADSLVRIVHRRGESANRGVLRMLADLLTLRVDLAAVFKDLALAPGSYSQAASRRRDGVEVRLCAIRGGKTSTHPTAIRQDQG